MFHRICWLLIELSSFLFASWLLLLFWSRYVSQITRVTVESNYVPIGQLEYPAITFCHINQVSNIQAMKLAKTL